jgi:hypothetical protein
MPDAVDTVVCAPDDGWMYHPKHVQQFPDKINCVTLHLVGYILEYFATSFDQLCGHPQTALTGQSRITILNLILDQNEFLFFHNAH